MATKAALAAALLVALVALAGATTYTTTVTTTSINDVANPAGRQCSQQVQGRRFQACQRFMLQRGSPYNDDEEDNQGQYVQECCQSLRQMDRQGCGCEAIRHALRQVQGGQQEMGQSQQVYQKAQQLPRICRLRSQQCQIHVVFL